MNRFAWTTLFVVLLCLMSTPLLLADTVWDTAYQTLIFPVSSQTGTDTYIPYSPGNSSIRTVGFDQGQGFTLSYDAEASAQRGTLHASASYTLTPPQSCPTCQPVAPIFEWGAVGESAYEEKGVHAVTLGPDLLTGITAYKVTFNLDGTVYPLLDPYIYAELFAVSIQDGKAKSSDSLFTSSPLGPVSFYVQPFDPTQPFDIQFDLLAFAYSQAGGPNAASVNFSNTASLVSILPVDANGNVIQGVELEAGDGTSFTKFGSTPTPSEVPEPSTLALFGTGLLGFTAAMRRRILA